MLQIKVIAHPIKLTWLDCERRDKLLLKKVFLFKKSIFYHKITHVQVFIEKILRLPHMTALTGHFANPWLIFYSHDIIMTLGLLDIEINDFAPQLLTRKLSYSQNRMQSF